jgi:predicted acetyltransferase
VRLRRRADTSLLDRLTDPRAATVERKPGPMVRLVDVADALSALSYPEDVSATVTLAVADPRCDWNEGRVELSVADGRGSVTRLAASSDDADTDADVRLGVGPLSQLAVGAVPAETLVAHGDATVTGERTVETLASLFPSETVYLREGF